MTWLESTLSTVLTLLSLPSVGLSAIFVWCTASATLLPLGSEPLVFAYVKLNQLNPYRLWAALFVATAGNTLGGMINYWLAFGTRSATSAIHQDNLSKALQWLQRFGAKSLFFSFLPVIGDPLTAMAGWLKLPWLPCLLWQAAGKFIRYMSVIVLASYVPDSWWEHLWQGLKFWV